MTLRVPMRAPRFNGTLRVFAGGCSKYVERFPRLGGPDAA
jgi:hypothetical protein